MQPIVRQHLTAIALFVLVTLFMTLPALGGALEYLIGSGGDPWQTVWRFENKWEQLSNAAEMGALGSYLQSEFLGGGEPRLVNVSVWPWMLLHGLFGQPLGYNLVWFLTFVLSGYGMYLLVSSLVQGQCREVATLGYKSLTVHAPAFLAGLVYMFLPYHVAHASGHFGAMQIQWLPFLLWAFFYTLRKPGWLGFSLIALFGILQAWSEHHYFFWFALLLPVLIGFRWREVTHVWRTHRTMLISAVILVSAVVLASYWPTIQLALQPESELSLGQEQTIRFSADLLSYVIPSSAHPVWGALAFTLFNQNFTGNASESIHFLGLVPLLFVLFFGQRIPKGHYRLWFWIALMFFLISLGPRLHILGRVLPLPFPYALIDQLPIFDVVRAVGRASIMVGLATSVLVGIVAGATIRRQKIYLIFCGLVLLEFLFLPVSLQAFETPAVYQQVHERPGARLIEIPAATNYTVASQSLWRSLQHDKEVVGNIALERAGQPELLEIIRSLPGLRQVLYLRTTHIRENRDDFFAQPLGESFLEAAELIDAKTVLIHTDSVSALQLATLRRFFEAELGLEPAQVGDTLLYSLPTPTSDGIIVARDSQWENVGFDPKRDSVFAEVPRSAGLTIYNTNEEPTTVLLQFGFAPESHGNLLITKTVPGEDEVVADLVLTGGAETTVLLPVNPGMTELTFENRLTQKVIIQNPQVRSAP